MRESRRVRVLASSVRGLAEVALSQVELDLSKSQAIGDLLKEMVIAVNGSAGLDESMEEGGQ